MFFLCLFVHQFCAIFAKKEHKKVAPSPVWSLDWGLVSLKMIQPLSTAFFDPGTEMRIKCQSEGAAIFWTKDGEDVNCDSGPINCSIIEDQAEGMLGTYRHSTLMLNVEKDDEGEYACWVNATGRLVSFKTLLHVKTTVFPHVKCSEGPYDSGDTAALDCSVEHMYPHMYFWMFKKNKEEKEWRHIGKGEQLLIQKMSDENVGHYKCVAKTMGTLGESSVAIAKEYDGGYHAIGSCELSAPYTSPYDRSGSRYSNESCGGEKILLGCACILMVCLAMGLMSWAMAGRRRAYIKRKRMKATQNDVQTKWQEKVDRERQYQMETTQVNTENQQRPPIIQREDGMDMRTKETVGTQQQCAPELRVHEALTPGRQADTDVKQGAGNMELKPPDPEKKASNLSMPPTLDPDMRKSYIVNLSSC